MAVVDPVFEKLLNKSTQFAVFRVQKLKLVEVTQNDFGKFYAGDCYIIFDNRYGGSHIFYWIGSESSLDEQSVVAIKAVELDNLFQGMPVQHREVQGNESVRFKKLFVGGIVILQGGFETGLQQVKREQHVPRLFQVMGGNCPVMREVKLSWTSMNHGDTFVLDSGSIIYVWKGSSSSGMENITASGLANKLRDKIGEEIVNVVDGEEEELTAEELEHWNKFLPLDFRSSELPSETNVTNDRKVSQIKEQEISLHKCSDMTGELVIDLVKTGNIQRSDMNDDDAYIINANNLGIWIWLGRKSNYNERKAAMKTGLKFIEINNLSEKTNVTKVFMGGEPEDFKSLFIEW